MKPIIAFVVALVVGTAGGTGVKVMVTKPAVHSGADSTHTKGDSTQTDSTAGDEKKDGETKKPSAAPSDSAHAAEAATPAVPGAPNLKPPLPIPAATAATAAGDTAVQSAERRLAKVFTSMEAKQAAKVLEHMSDGDVHIILGYVGPRQAATILAELPPERVATLSKIAMQKPAGSK